MPWTEERRKEAAERMRAIQAKRREMNMGSPFAPHATVPESTGSVAPALAPEAPVVEVIEPVKTEAAPERGQRVKTTEYLIRVTNQNQMVSLLGPCICGVGKKRWHNVCMGGKNG